MDMGTNFVLLTAHLLFILVGFLTKPARLIPYLAGYFVLFFVLFIYSGRFLIFSLFLVLYSTFFRNPYLLGYLIILFFSIILIPPYWIQSSLFLCALYALFWEVKKKWQSNFLFIAFSFGFFILLLILFPLAYLVFQSNPQTLLVTLKLSEFQRSLGLSLLTATLSTGFILLFGVPLSYGLARMDFKGKHVVESMIDLPILIPQSIVGIALLAILGPKTPIGHFLAQQLHVNIAGSVVGIVMAQIFVSAPFLIKSSMNAFLSINPKLENVSRNLGASAAKTFWRISLPLALPGILNGCILSWARALSEVGSLMVLAYHPFTVAIFTYDTFTQFGIEEAKPIAILVIIFCLWAFIVLRWLTHMKTGILTIKYQHVED